MLTPRKLHQQQSQPTQQQQPSRATGVPPPPPKLLREQPAEPIEETTAEEPQPQQQQRRVIAIQQREQSQQQDDRMRSVIGAEQEVSTSGYVNVSLGFLILKIDQISDLNYFFPEPSNIFFGQNNFLAILGDFSVKISSFFFQKIHFS